MSDPGSNGPGSNGSGSSWRGGAGRLSAVVALLVVTALAAMAAPVYDGYFDGSRHEFVLATAASAGALAGLLLLIARDRGRLVAGVVAVLAVVCAVPVLLSLLEFPGHGLPTPAAVGDLANDLLRGWSRMTSTGLPAAPQAELLVLPATLGWVSAFAGVLLLRDPARRLLPALPGVATLFLGLMLSAATGPPRWLVAGTVAGLVVLLLIVRPGPAPAAHTPAPSSIDGTGTLSSPEGLSSAGEPLEAVIQDAGPTGAGSAANAAVQDRITAAGIAVVVLTVVAGIAVGVVHALPSTAIRTPYDPRGDAHPATELIDASSPMIGIKTQLKPPARQLFTVRVRNSQLRSGAPPLIRLAALDSFDGSTWQVTGQYLRPGARIPGSPGFRRPLNVTLQVVVSGLGGPLLPVPQGRTSQLDLDDLRVDAAGTNVVATRAVRSGLTYTVTSVVAGGDQTDLANAVPDHSGDAANSTELPDLPPAFAHLAASLLSRSNTPFGQLMAIRNWLRSLPYGTDEPPGESYAVLEPVLFGPDGDGRNRPASYAEQRVSAFAVLARTAGFPARVAVGYQLDPNRATGGLISVNSTDIRAWAEVKLAGYGWVRFDPTDTTQGVDSTPRTSQDLQQQQATGTANNQSVIDPGLRPDDVRRSGGGAVAGLISALPFLPLLVLLLLLVGWLLKVLRRRRRRRGGDPRSQVLGAWRECRDRLLEAGRPPTRAQTPADAARESDRLSTLSRSARSARQSGAQPVSGAVGELLRMLAALVAEAAFAPWGPEAEQATAAWRCHDQLRRTLDRSTAFWVRPLRRLDPRPLWHRPGRRAVPGGSTWPPGLRTPTPDEPHLAAVLIAERPADSDPQDGGRQGHPARRADQADQELDLLIESMLATSNAASGSHPPGGSGSAGDVLVETPGVVLGREHPGPSSAPRPGSSGRSQ